MTSRTLQARPSGIMDLLREGWRQGRVAGIVLNMGSPDEGLTEWATVPPSRKCLNGHSDTGLPVRRTHCLMAISSPYRYTLISESTLTNLRQRILPVKQSLTRRLHLCDHSTSCSYGGDQQSRQRGGREKPWRRAARDVIWRRRNCLHARDSRASPLRRNRLFLVFIRELISNCSDALEKLRHKLVSLEGESSPMEIHLKTNPEKHTIIIQDTGIGMSKEELVSNLGTIARSGSKAFLDALQNQSEASSKIIGQFGVGFYSAFMVADKVDVYSKSAEPGSDGYKWSSDGSGVFEVAKASGVRLGTKIVIHLKDECKEFASEDRVKEIVTKYSNFVSFPIFLNGRRLNTLQALWLADPKEISDWQHEEFYRYIAQAYDKPRYVLHYRTDAPLNIRSIFYVPEMKPSMFDVSREMGSSVALYSRKVLIQTKASDILPKWLRFLRGVVDSEDIPLNLSRELLQESALIRKLRDVLQKRIVKFFVDQSHKEPEKYRKFFEDYGLFIREGIVTSAEQDVKEDIGKLLRFESSVLPEGQQTSLQEYAERMKAGTRNIYYLCAPNRHLAEHSPYFEAMQKKDMEVLFCYEQFDELTLLHLREFDKKKLISVETDIVVDHYKEEQFEDSKPGGHF
ncbi:TRAP1 protein, partial [Polypterus senegalus]